MKPILGHNQFIGVCHVSDTKARKMSEHFSSSEKIMEVVEKAHDIGYRWMIVETHPRMFDFLKHYQDVQTVEMNLILQTPHIQAYVRKMSTVGIKGMVLDMMKESKPTALAKGFLRSMKDIATSKYANLGATGLELIAAEYFQFGMKKVMMHNAITDLLIALNMQDVLMATKDRIESDYGVDVGFITLNLPMLLDSMEEYGAKYDVLTPVNPRGFDMNPSQERVLEAIQQTNQRITAMNILAGGAVSIADSAEYLRSIPKIQHCVIGSSNPVHLKEDFEHLTVGRIDSEVELPYEKFQEVPVPPPRSQKPVPITSLVGP